MFSAVLLLVILILIHELGHFIAARLVGVRVETFSIGFGPKLISKKIGDTEWKISAIPLGGYVKMTGESLEDEKEVKEEDKKVSFSHQKWWKKLIIVLAGPLTNILFAVPLYMIVASYQLETTSSTIEFVSYESPAEKSGLEPGDKVVALNSIETHIWDDIVKLMPKPLNNVCEEITVKVIKTGTEKEISYKMIPELSSYKDVFGDKKEYCKIGISSQIIPPVLYIPYTIAGINSEDTFVTMDSRKITRYHDIKRELLNGASYITTMRNNTKVSVVLTPIERKELLLLMQPIGMTIKKIKEESVAQELGFLKGDLILSVDDKPVLIPYDFARYFREKSTKKEKIVTFIRGDITDSITVPAEYENRDNPYTGQKQKSLKWGAEFSFNYIPSQQVSRDNPASYIISSGFTTTKNIARDTLKGVWYMISGKLSAKGLGGPIMVFDISAKAAKRGLKVFLYMMGVISINLGLINLFPIPVLDGGHIVFFTIEGIIKKPVSRKIRERLMTGGLILLMALMLFAVTNDILRYINIFGADGG